MVLLGEPHLVDHRGDHVDLGVGDDAVHAFQECFARRSVDLQEREVLLLAADVALVENQLVVADEVELEALQPRYDPVGVVRLRDQDAVQHEHREGRVGAFQDGRATFVGKDDEV